MEPASRPDNISPKTLPHSRISMVKTSNQRASLVPVRGRSLEPLLSAHRPPQRKKSELLPTTNDDDNFLIEVKFENPQLQKHFVKQKALVDRAREDMLVKRNAMPASAAGAAKPSLQERR